MDGQTTGTTEAVENSAPVDPWIAAFEALEPKSEEAAEANAGTGDNASGVADSSADASDGQDSAQNESGDSASNEDASGGLDTPAGTDAVEGGESAGSVFGIEITDEDSIKKFEEDINTEIRERAINDIAKEFVKRGVRNRNGALGATLDDPDICKRDEDGVPRFYNPETGREFTGDNPRRQAQEWVDDYNKELARVYNEACQQYEKVLKQEVEPQIAVRRFAPKYDKLDEIRRGMFDNVIQDYEIKDNNGNVVGYSCDLDKALALVDRQISMIQGYAKKHQGEQKPAPTGPALDMKTSSGAVPSGEQKPPSSLAEAMERIQDKELEKLKNK